MCLSYSSASLTGLASRKMERLPQPALPAYFPLPCFRKPACKRGPPLNRGEDATKSSVEWSTSRAWPSPSLLIAVVSFFIKGDLHGDLHFPTSGGTRIFHRVTCKPDGGHFLGVTTQAPARCRSPPRKSRESYRSSPARHGITFSVS